MPQAQTLLWKGGDNMTKPTNEQELLKALEAVHNTFAESTERIARRDSDDPVTHGELYNAMHSISLALLDIGTAFDNYFYNK